MKALSIKQAYFRLPDNFDGGLSDALRLLADYHDEVASKSSTPAVVEADPELLNRTFKEVDNVLFDRFIQSIQQNKRFVGLVQLADFNPRVPVEIM